LKGKIYEKEKETGLKKKKMKHKYLIGGKIQVKKKKLADFPRCSRL
jgi:hypothetical protein